MLVVAFSGPPASREASQVSPLRSPPPVQVGEASSPEREIAEPEVSAAEAEGEAVQSEAHADQAAEDASASPVGASDVAAGSVVSPDPEVIAPEPESRATSNGAWPVVPAPAAARADTQAGNDSGEEGAITSTGEPQRVGVPADAELPDGNAAATVEEGTSAPDPVTRPRIDPRERLAREFARRAAARDRGPSEAIPAAPPADEVYPPAVFMSQAHRERCLVFVGDTVPDATLPDSAGEPHEVRESLGKQLTAILFWNEEHPYALDQFQELPHDLVPFRPLGVAILSVHVGPPGEDYGALCEELGQDVLCLVDREGEYFRQVYQGPVPCILLLDAKGQVLWLDIEYSRSTRYELRNALHYFLQDKRSEEAASAP